MSTILGIHGVIESGPDDQGRYRFVLFWAHDGDRNRAQQFHARLDSYQHAIWHPDEEAAKVAAWGKAVAVTNDAEAVVVELANKFGRRRILYFDSDGNLDELLHEGGVFLGYKPGPGRA